MYFYYAGRRAARLTCRAFSLVRDGIPDGEYPPPNHVAWLDLEELACLRRAYVFGRTLKCNEPSHAENTPSSRRAETLLRYLTPQHTLQDPYMAAVLIALTQSQRSTSAEQCQGRSDDNGTYWRAVLMVTSHKQRCVYIYSTNISAEFLERFDRPDCSPPITNAGLTIECRQLQLQEYETFPRRLEVSLREAYYTPRPR